MGTDREPSIYKPKDYSFTLLVKLILSLNLNLYFQKNDLKKIFTQESIDYFVSFLSNEWNEIKFVLKCEKTEFSFRGNDSW